MGTAIIKAAGDTVTIGDFSSGYPMTSTWGIPIHSRDAGVPLSLYTPGGADPLVLWKTQPSLRKVVTFAARQIGAIPWHAYLRVSDTDRQRQRESPAEKKLHRPGPLSTGFKLWHDVAVDKLVFDMFCVLNLDGNLVRIPPRLLELRSDFLGQVKQVLLHTPAGQDNIDLTDAPMALSYGWHPNGGSGVSPMLTLQQILEESRRSVEWRDRQWDNAPKISGLLKRPADAPKWGDTQRTRFIESWREWRQAPLMGGTPVLEDGMDYAPLDTFNPKDTRDIEGRQLTDAEVASAFHIPPELVGAREGNFSNIAAFRQMLFGPTLGPLFEELKQAVNSGLVASLDATTDLYVEQDREAAINGSFLEQAKLLSTMTGGPIMTRAEGRAKLNLPFIEGTDELILPLNVVEGGQTSPQDTGSQNEGTGTEPEGEFPSTQ